MYQCRFKDVQPDCPCIMSLVGDCFIPKAAVVGLDPPSARSGPLIVVGSVENVGDHSLHNAQDASATTAISKTSAHC